MAARRRARAREAQVAFEAISIEGGLLSPEWLSRVAQVSAGGQSEADYRIKKGLSLRDEIGRYWRIARAHWAEFAAGRGSADARELAHRFVVALLREAFEFESLAKSEPVVIAERAYPIGHHALDGRVPIVIAPAGAGLETSSTAFGDGGRRRTAFGVAQEYLNAQERALWGVATDGVTLRIVRDNASLTRPAWIEADLERIFTEERYADFAALWLLAHETRFGRPDQPVTDCALETWRNAGREEGTRAREDLRRGVEDAILALGQGFLSHPDNNALRADLHSNALTTKELFNQLLRLVYRLIFLLTAEERALLHPDGADARAKAVYADGYSMRRLRDRSVKRSAHDRYSDVWEATKIVMRGLAMGEPRLALPALAGIFAKSQCPALDAAKLTNGALLLAVYRLAWLRDDSGLARVNWRDMGPEELGSVYESLLELVPQITKDGREFAFATGGETKGNARKTTGSYYTPDSLVQVLLDSALEPVIADTIAKNPDRAVNALLELSIVDPACGSGHFLLGAARRLAAHVARLRANGTPSSHEYRHALRQVVGRCIYGVDLNPMAVELCRVSLWMEALEPGLPLTFLNSHVQHGNALLGTTPELMAKGIPDAAWDPIEGDDKKIASALKKQNKKERTEMSLDFSSPPASTYARLGAGARAVDEEDDATLAGLETKEQHWAELVASAAYEHQRFLADTWCAAFVWKKEAGPLRDIAPTEGMLRALQRDSTRAAALLREEVGRLRRDYAWFHWQLQFPQVFAAGGFDVVVGNPPWDQLQLDAREWFAARAPDVAGAKHHSDRQLAIAALERSGDTLWAEYSRALRVNSCTQAFIHTSGRYPLTSSGRLNTAPLFTETATGLIDEAGFVGMIVPTGIATDSFTQDFFRHLVESRRLHTLLSFENEEFIFPGVHHATKFCVLTIGGRSRRAATVTLTFFARNLRDLSDPERVIRLAADDFTRFNPNTSTAATFRTRRDAEINARMYRRMGVLVDETRIDGDPWRFRSVLMFMTNLDSKLFVDLAELRARGATLIGSSASAGRDRYAPFFEAKMVHHFDHRFGTYAGQTVAQSNQGKLPELDDLTHDDPREVAMPNYWVPRTEVDERLSGKWEREWLLGWRDICRSTDQRTLIASLLPRVATAETFILALAQATPRAIAALYANMCSFVLDYAARQKVGGTHLRLHVAKQLPVCPPDVFESIVAWSGGPVLDWMTSRVAELAYTSWDLEHFAIDLGYNNPPFRWDPRRRFLLRAELDAAFFHLYGLSRDDADYVLETFPIVRKNDEKAHGEYRTKRVILEIYDAMAEAVRTGRPYETPIDPPPADPRVAHPDDPARRSAAR